MFKPGAEHMTDEEYIKDMLAYLDRVAPISPEKQRAIAKAFRDAIDREILAKHLESYGGVVSGR